MRSQLALLIATFICQQMVMAKTSSDSTTSKKPHILFIVADDLGYNDVGYHGSEVRTPTIDTLSKYGVRLESYYVQPMCSPSRGALMSGRYPIHTGLQHEVIYAGQRAGLPLSMKTLANELRDRGYSTHGVGKWHLGFFDKDYLPVQRGFDSWKGYLTGNEDYYVHTNCEQLGCGYDFWSNNSVDYTDNGTYSTFLFTQHAKEIIEEHEPTKPLFLYMPYQAVHFPMQVPESYLNEYAYIDDKTRMIFAGMATCMDESIRNVTQYFMDRGMWNNTVVIFTTDNGGETSRGGNNWPLRGKKWTLWEGGIRGAAFVHSPLLNMSEGTVHKSLMHISDWYPTIIEGILGESLPANLSLDGMNMWNSIVHGTQGPRKEILHNIDPLMPHPGDALYNNTFPTNTTAAIRVGDWKLLTGYPGVGEWFPPFTSVRKRHSQWFLKFLSNREADVFGSAMSSVKKALLRYDTSFHTAVDPQLSYTIERYDPAKWLNESKLDIQLTSTGLKKNVWLFNITADPEEIVDLSESYPDVVLELLSRLAYYNSTAVPPNFPDVDPAAAPELNDGLWRPWVNADRRSSLIQRVLSDLGSILKTAKSLFASSFSFSW